MRRKPECTIDANGSKEWWLNNKLHRTNGPAIEWYDGSKEWWLNGKRHRIDGPAIEWGNGSKRWHLNGEEIEPQVLVKKGYITQEELFLILL